MIPVVYDRLIILKIEQFMSLGGFDEINFESERNESIENMQLIWVRFGSRAN